MLANQRRGEARRSALQARIVQSTHDDVEPAAGSRGDSAVLRACAALSPRDQEILLLVAWDRLDRGQAARVLGISTATFAVRLHRARRRLERALATETRTVHPAGNRSTSEVL